MILTLVILFITAAMFAVGKVMIFVLPWLFPF